MSTYRERLILWPELALDAVFFAIVFGWELWAGALGLAFAICMRLVVRRFGPQNHLRIDADGLHFPRMSVPWTRVSGTEPAKPPLYWSAALSLDPPFTWPWWLSPFKVRRISLGRYERDWMNGRIGRDLARWAPHLLSDGTRSKA